MYKFHYDYIQNKCGNKSKLLFTLLLFLVSEIKTENVYDYYSKNKEIFSNRSAKSKRYNDSNVLIVGKMKDKMGSVPFDQVFESKPELH